MHFQPIETPSKVLAELYAQYPDLREAFSTTKKVPTALVVSSTSWTEDEDFGILLDALQGLYLICTTIPYTGDNFSFAVCCSSFYSTQIKLVKLRVEVHQFSQRKKNYPDQILNYRYLQP